MRFIIFILFCLGIQNQDFSQVISGLVTDVNGVSLQGVNIINQSNNFGVFSDAKGEFLIKAVANDKLKFSYVGKETTLYSVKKTDTIFIKIKLLDKYSQLNTYVVDGRRIKSVSVKNNDNIFDYESIGTNTFLVLKRRGKQYQLAVEGVDTVYKIYPLTQLRPRLLFLDVFGNFHMICKDSVRQLYLDTNLKFIATISLADFENIIKPIIYKDYSFLLRYRYSMYNKKYSIYKNRSLFYEVYDEESAEYMKHVLRQSKGEQNSVNVNTVKELKRNRNKMQSGFFHKSVLSREIKVDTYMDNENVIVFNLEFKKMIQLNLSNEVERQYKLAKRYDKIVLDKEQEIFYGYSLYRGVVSLDRIDLKSGKVMSTFRLSKISFPKELKIIDGWIYYIKTNKNNYNKLRRVAIS